MRIWDLETGEKKATIDVGPVDLWTVAFSPDDKHIVSGSHEGKITLYSVDTAKAEQSLETRGKFTLSIAYVRCFQCIIAYLKLFNIFTYFKFYCTNGKA